ncbi:hypothetical protein HNP37_001994 [Flavobacterium nitrogenifigens]|uniref:MoxR-vWA-beta-propeller ternary system domain-containing protein n=2 Tax=Flavobacterium TaxID=237 RepID=A0A7W7N6Q8_9FLAO|nr:MULTISPECIES: hypothetical protein [Flavobacterium]MBB4801933.1 hypothetical protein [Flavobacterium nitrogenifigens]MBB6386891.1 hypothetical protein [Flavobacterium notoginsengisoli]
MSKPKTPFLETIYHLRTIEQIILYNKVIAISEKEETETIQFLETEYEKEILEYPGTAPKFNPQAALWGAKTIYISAQLLLNREHKISDLEVLLSDYKGKQNASAILSADLCLRFLPQIIAEMKRVDPEDLVVPILEKHISRFHYSAIGSDIEIENIDYENIAKNDCLLQLYIDRIVHRKAIKFAQSDFIKKQLEIGFGDYQKLFWTQL